MNRKHAYATRSCGRVRVPGVRPLPTMDTGYPLPFPARGSERRERATKQHKEN